MTSLIFFFVFNNTATTKIYTLSLHDALPIFRLPLGLSDGFLDPPAPGVDPGRIEFFRDVDRLDRKSTRLNSSHSQISYAVFCLKKKKKNQKYPHYQIMLPTYE